MVSEERRKKIIDVLNKNPEKLDIWIDTLNDRQMDILLETLSEYYDKHRTGEANLQMCIHGMSVAQMNRIKRQVLKMVE